MEHISQYKDKFGLKIEIPNFVKLFNPKDSKSLKHIENIIKDSTYEMADQCTRVFKRSNTDQPHSPSQNFRKMNPISGGFSSSSILLHTSQWNQLDEKSNQTKISRKDKKSKYGKLVNTVMHGNRIYQKTNLKSQKFIEESLPYG